MNQLVGYVDLLSVFAGVYSEFVLAYDFSCLVLQTNTFMFSYKIYIYSYI